MELLLERDIATDSTTLGRLYVNNIFECFTLEDAVRDVKIPGETAIPAGRYRVVVTLSQRFKRILPLLLDVPNFSGIRIHSGNVDADTEGCILVGRGRRVNLIELSRLALQPLVDKITQAITRHDDVWITIRERRGTDAWPI